MTRRILDTLRLMHTYQRPAGSYTERAFINRWIANLPNAVQDNHANWHVTIGHTNVIWSCHTDTVHRRPGRQHVRLDADILTTPDGDCLGADDTAGVWLCREMVLAKRPGHYIFHYGEERGGIGSGDLARFNPEYLDGADIAIAFDRKGTGDVITHQARRRTASDTFAASLASELGRYGLDYRPDDSGVYTDTAEYDGLLSECTNISVGYEHAHSSKELLDVDHILALRDAVLRLDVGALVIGRRPGEDDPDPWDDDDYRGGFDFVRTPDDDALDLVRAEFQDWWRKRNR